MREFFRQSLGLTDAKPEEGTFKGYGCVFNTPIDTWCPTLIEPGAFAKTLQENGKRVRILYQHDSHELIGKPAENGMRETSVGFEIEGKISATPRGMEVRTLIGDGVATDLSIGFDTIRAEFEERPGMEPLRRIKELRLWEVSVVTWGANEPAKITELYSALRVKHLEQLARDGRLPETLLDQLRAGAGALTDDVVLERFVARLQAADSEEALRLTLGPLLFLEAWAGKVLSAKNKAIVQDAIAAVGTAGDALKALLAAAEPDPDTQGAPLTARLEQLRTAQLAFASEIMSRAA